MAYITFGTGETPSAADKKFRGVEKKENFKVSGSAVVQAVVTAGLKNVTAGANPMDLKRGIDQAVEAIVAGLKELSRDIDDRNEIAQVGTISANNDEFIGNLIADAMEKVGKDGVITV